MKKSKRVLFIGDDRGYWQTLEQRFSTTYEHVDLTFDNWPVFDSSLVNTKLIEIMQVKPDFIYIDLSKSSKEMFQLALYLKRITRLAQIPLIGLIENEKYRIYC